MYPETDAGVTTSGLVGPTIGGAELAQDAELADWHLLSLMSLWEVWDNDEDAAYDSL